MTKVTISVSDHLLGCFDSIVQQCERQGLQVDQAMEALGVIYGHIENGSVADLQQVAGVEAVERAYEYQLPPSKSPIQ